MKKICPGDICVYNPVSNSPANSSKSVYNDPSCVYVLKVFGLFKRKALVLILDKDLDFSDKNIYIVPIKRIYPLNNQFLPNIIVRYRPDTPTFSAGDIMFMHNLEMNKNLNDSLSQEQKTRLRSITLKMEFFMKGINMV